MYLYHVYPTATHCNTEDKWYTIVLVETLLAVLQQFLLTATYCNKLQCTAMHCNTEDKWYTIVLVETLLAVLQQFRLPDIDLCISEEVPQVLKVHIPQK